MQSVGQNTVQLPGWQSGQAGSGLQMSTMVSGRKDLLPCAKFAMDHLSQGKQ